MRLQIEQFSQAAINIISYDILELGIVVPKLVFDYSVNPNINNGYYMYQNVTGDIITLNMNSIMSLRDINDIKTVITYGFIHEIMHMYQSMSSKYITDSNTHNYIEDIADLNTIRYIRENMNLLNTRLNFVFNDIFLMGIERQIQTKNISVIDFDTHSYISKSVAGALTNKLNYNFDYLYKTFMNANVLKIFFPCGRIYYLDLDYGTSEELNILINLIYLTDFKMIHINFIEFIDSYREGILELKLIGGTRDEN